MKSPVEPESTRALAEMRRFPTRSMTERISLESVAERPVNVIEEIWKDPEGGVGLVGTGGVVTSSVVRGVSE